MNTNKKKSAVRRLAVCVALILNIVLVAEILLPQSMAFDSPDAVSSGAVTAPEGDAHDELLGLNADAATSGAAMEPAEETGSEPPSGGAAAPSFIETNSIPPPIEPVISNILAFAPLEDDVRYQRGGAPTLPETLEATVDSDPKTGDGGKQNSHSGLVPESTPRIDSTPETADVPVSWAAEGYKPGDTGLFVFIAAPGEGYACADGVELPRITALVTEPESAGGVMRLFSSGRVRGLGTAESPLEITNADQLAEIAALVNKGGNALEYFVFGDRTKKIHIGLMNDIGLSSYGKNSAFNEYKGWIPIGKDEDGKRFRGVFDGGGHKVTELYIDDSVLDFAGLFGYLGGTSSTDRAVVKNLGVDCSVAGRNYVGGVAGFVENSAIENSYATGSVSGSGSVGGVAGSVGHYSTIENCYATGSVSGTRNSVGGVAGSVVKGSTIESCYATGSVSGSDSVGGVAGVVSGEVYSSTIESCYATGPVSGDYSVGGVAGSVGHYSTIENCYATGEVSGTRNSVGGVAGYVDYYSTIESCYATGSVSGSDYVGGVAGEVYYYSTIESCYATGAVSGNDRVGGVAGYFYNNSTIENSYATGEVSGSYYVGGVAGYVDFNSTIENCYANGSVNGDISVGGVAGRVMNDATIESCYATGSVSGSDSVGGVAGYVDRSTIENCYATGEVSGVDYAGGVAGFVENSNVTSCAALNPSVTASSGAVSLGRVAGYIEISTLADNAAYDGMTLTYNGGSLTYTPESGANLKDGASVSKDGLQDLTTLTGFPSSLTQPPWVYTPADIGDNKLPGLPGPGGDGAAIDMPEHLRSSATYNSSGDGVDNGKLPEPGGDDADAGTTDSTLSAANEFSGDGTEDNPWLIGAPADLALLAELVNTGAAVYADAGKHYKLMNDISLADYDADDTDFNDGKGWIPIGQEEEGKRFRGVFDGNGHKITDLYISDGALDCAGLFGYVSGESTESRAEVKNLGVYGEVSGVGSVGGVAGVVNNNSTIENSYATGPVSGNGDVGGVAGVVNNNSTIENSYATGPVSGNGDVGGVAGCVLRSSTIENCYATGAVNGTGYNVGGVAGYVDNSTIENCYATGAVNGSDYVGGVAGYVLNGNVTSCAALNIGVRTSSASDAFIGRAVGESYSSVLSGLTAFNETPVTYSTSTTPKDITEGEATMAGKDGLGFTEGGREGADGDVIEQGFLLAGFWTGVMGWDENVWSFADDRLPVLKDVAGYVDDDNLGKQTGDVGLYASGQHIEHAVVTRGAVTGATGGDGTAASPYTYVYNGNKRLDAEDQAKLGLTVKFGDKTLEMQEDYVLSRYKYTASGDITDPDRTNVTGKDITLTVAGRKNYTGIADAAVFRITPKSLAGASVTVRGYYYYNGWAWTPANVAVALDGEMLEAGKDYTLSYSSNVYAGEAKVAVTGTGNYKDTAIGAFTIFGAYDSGDKTSEQPAAEQVDITFDANGGEVSGKPLLVRSVKSGSKLGKLSIPTRNGHKFSGWYTKRTGGKKISASTEAPSKDSTYYAHWEKIYGKAIAAVNVRKSPNEKAPAVGRIKKGQTFEIRRFIDNPGKSNDWYVKKHKGKTAYLPARYVEEV